ncbi:hypothetical protein COT30_00115 [Candidatus Micrarchaeota archaeon CG08_land_8_20_14_0_20_49_17]|nr:MAG: hypothetical protein AUJ13_02655 [Candidatus Micrarchaeota archaeon CG1_02_49_24]PIU10260.1 MAG: hypothetical protein COT30_00115 [Candidatus Micrarchaeota archaeon CG08_land_8_20_14_0_20_49_17]
MGEDRELSIRDQRVLDALGGTAFVHSVYTASKSADAAGIFYAKVPFIDATIEIRDGKVAGKNRYTVSGAELIRASAQLLEYEADRLTFEPLSIALRGLPLTPKSVGYLASLRSDGKGRQPWICTAADWQRLSFLRNSKPDGTF